MSEEQASYEVDKVAKIKEEWERANNDGKFITEVHDDGPVHRWIGDILSELEQQKEENRKLQEVRDEWRINATYWNNEHTKETERADRLQGENGKLIEGLQKLARTNIDARILLKEVNP